MANNQNNSNVKTKEAIEFKNAKVICFPDFEKYGDRKGICFKVTEMDDYSGFEVVNTKYYLLANPNLYYSPFVGKMCNITVEPGPKRPDMLFLTKISLVETEEKGGLTI